MYSAAFSTVLKGGEAMMCLGWTNNPICQSPDVVQVIAPSASATATGVAATCPDITWFYISAALVAVGAFMRGGK